MANPATGISSAISAYNTAAKKGIEGLGSRDNQEQDSFANLVKDAIQEAKSIGIRGEQQSIAAIRDKADLNQVVTAVAEAEVTLQTVVTIRDKVLEAYKEIIRMPI